jgi:hypothetical protein
MMRLLLDLITLSGINSEFGHHVLFPRQSGVKDTAGSYIKRGAIFGKAIRPVMRILAPKLRLGHS